ETLDAPAKVLAHAVGITEQDVEPSRLLREGVLRSEAGEALRAVCHANGTLVPQTPLQLGVSLFSSLPEAERDEAAEGLLVCLSAALPAPVRLRAHLFFRSVQGMWACTDPECKEAKRQEATPVGKLYHQ